MREPFINKNFHHKSRLVIQHANDILTHYQRKGLTLTLRQLYYQFVARDLFVDRFALVKSRWRRVDKETDPEGWAVATINAESNYDMLGNVVSDARLAGLIDWDSIEDRTRFLRGHTTYEDPADAIAKLNQRYRIDFWENQSVRLEVWIEKDALVGVVERVCRLWDINYFACKGYASQSELYAAGKRIQYRREHGNQETLVLHLGDHDPSGMDMTRDNCDRLSLFSGSYVEVKRLALNMDQVEQYNPPPNFAKLTDSRAGQYVEEFGSESWELDALTPEVISALIQDEVDLILDTDDNRELWNVRVRQFNADRFDLRKAVAFVGEIAEGDGRVYDGEHEDDMSEV